MAYVITQNCCKDASCVPVCPVDCIRPAGDGGEVSSTEMLYIDPVTCIDCGACLEECPVDAIYHEDDLPEHLQRFRDLNAAYFDANPLEMSFAAATADHPPVEAGSLRVAIVGAGPAACYSAAELLRVNGVRVNVFERLPTPFGLIRAGVAPDHQHTKSIVDVFEPVFTNPRLKCYLNVEVGQHLTHEDLLAHHHAVLYAVGAPRSRDLGIAGEDLPGCHAAADFVAWYNGHPDHVSDTFDFSGRRAVIIGNGNVALDAARVLLMSADELARTDIAEHALKALSDSTIREVVVLGRRAPADAAFSVGELLALGNLAGIDIVVEGDDGAEVDGADAESRAKVGLLREFRGRANDPGNKRIVFRFMAAPAEVLGEGHAQGVRLVGHGDDAGEVIDSGLILKSLGYRGVALSGVPFDAGRGVVPNEHGRVVDEQHGHRPGVYVTGWIKRGPRGVIGTNRTCARETVARLWEDYDSGRLNRPVADQAGLDRLLADGGAEPVDWRGWQAIDAAERDRGSALSRPRVKFVDIADMLAVADV